MKMNQAQKQSTLSSDGTRIVYDTVGNGPWLMLLHGAGKSRRDWHKLGYVQRLAEYFTVISVDLRGSGESDFLTDIADYPIEKIVNDLIAVADACNAGQFAVLGYSLGGNVARYLAARTERVTALVMVGVPFGPAVAETFDKYIDTFIEKWGPITDAYRAGEDKTEQHRSAIKGRIPVWVACFQAMRQWPSINPEDIRCPILLVCGSKNTSTMQWIETHPQILRNERVRIEIVEGLNHQQEFSQMEHVYPKLEAFLTHVGN